MEAPLCESSGLAGDESAAGFWRTLAWVGMVFWVTGGCMAVMERCLLEPPRSQYVCKCRAGLMEGRKRCVRECRKSDQGSNTRVHGWPHVFRVSIRH